METFVNQLEPVGTSRNVHFEVLNKAVTFIVSVVYATLMVGF